MIEGVKIQTEEERKLQDCHYPTPESHNKYCHGSDWCYFNDPEADNYLKECTCCEGYCGGSNGGEECRCAQISHLL